MKPHHKISTARSNASSCWKTWQCRWATINRNKWQEARIQGRSTLGMGLH